jgi:hypothetical protein
VTSLAAALDRLAGSAAPEVRLAAIQPCAVLLARLDPVLA